MTSTKKTKAYSYVRFSTPDQARGDSQRRQVEAARRYATTRDLELDDTLTFKDLGVSAFRGANVETGRLGEFLEAVRTGLVARGSYLLVESLDRISRDKARRALRALEDICDEGITVVTLMDNREYTGESLDNDPTALLMSILIFMRANEESETKARRGRAAWTAKRRKAKEKPLTARAPAWLRLDKETGEWGVLEDKAEIVRRIYRLTLAGHGQWSISVKFNKENVPKFGRGKQWHRSYIVKLLRHTPAVIGTFVPHTQEYISGKRVRIAQEPIEDYFPAIVSRDVYDRVQGMIKDTDNPQRGRPSSREVKNLLGGLTKCPLCGSTMSRVSKGRSKKAGKAVLVCNRAKAGAGCQYKSVPYDYVEQAFLDDLLRLLGTMPTGEGESDLDKEIASTEAGIDVMRDSLVDLLEAIEIGGESKTVMAKIRETEEAITEAEKDLDELWSRRLEIQGPVTEAKRSELWQTLEAEPMDRLAVNGLLRQLLKEVVVDYQSGLLLCRWAHGGESDVMYAWPLEDDSKVENGT